MSDAPKKTMRDTFLGGLLNALDKGENIFLLSADFGAPALDVIRERHPKRFINVGIAEQNLVNVATGLGLEGYKVYAYAIAPFITMRCYEQIRVNLAVLSQVRPMNVNLIGVGAGFSYEVSGPTHHCLEDLSIMRTLPNMEVLSPADWTTAEAMLQHTLQTSGPKYLRFDAKPQAALHEKVTLEDIKRGFIPMREGKDTCIVSTGVMTHKAVAVVNDLAAQGKNIGLIDMIAVKKFNEAELVGHFKKYKKIVSLEEGFIGKGGLDSALGNLVLQHRLPVQFKAMGLKDQYFFHVGTREYLHQQNDLGFSSVAREATTF